MFGGYRDPQVNDLSLGFDDSFFNDALDMDFPTPYNLPLAGPGAPKKDLIAQIDAAKEDDSTPAGQLLNCNKIWYASKTIYPDSFADLLTTPQGKAAELPQSPERRLRPRRPLLRLAEEGQVRRP